MKLTFYIDFAILRISAKTHLIMKKDKIREKGQVVEALPSLLFRIKLESGEIVLAHLGGKMRLYRIKVLPGDKVLVELSPYDRKRGRIVYRAK